MSTQVYDGERAAILAKVLRNLSGEPLADCRICVERVGIDRIGTWLVSRGIPIPRGPWARKDRTP